MTPERVLTLCVGISVYESRLLEPGEKPLEFLASSAIELSTTFRCAWASGDSRHLVALDGDATWSHVRNLVETHAARYDLFLLYLGGHGRLRDSKFQFVF